MLSQGLKGFRASLQTLQLARTSRLDQKFSCDTRTSFNAYTSFYFSLIPILNNHETINYIPDDSVSSIGRYFRFDTTRNYFSCKPLYSDEVLWASCVSPDSLVANTQVAFASSCKIRSI